MVKGISRRVVVVDSPDQRFFEQAIFIVRNDAAGEGVTAKELLPASFDGYRIVHFSDAHVGTYDASRQHLLQQFADSINAHSHQYYQP